MIMINSDYELEGKPRFEVGQLVRHKRYHYRGVVVAFDLKCQAGDDWYYSNQTQPDRDQPWYHVLVDALATVTYPAESSLQADTCTDPIEHPMIDLYFESFNGRNYVRNQTPWRG